MILTVNNLSNNVIRQVGKKLEGGIKKGENLICIISYAIA